MLTILMMLSRARLIVFGTFLLVAIPLCTLVALKSKKYEAHLSLLVRNERPDLLVSGDPHQNEVQHGDVTEADVNSEVELLSSPELLLDVARTCGLDREFAHESGGPEAALESATRKLAKTLVITPVRKSALIQVSYTSKDRVLSAKVLEVLAKKYLAKYAELHTSHSAAGFFENKSAEVERQLAEKKNLRASLLEQNGFTVLPQQRELSLQQMQDIRKQRNESVTSLAETRSRLQQVLAEKAANPSRVTTQDRTAANQYSIERLNTMLAEMQNRRTELVTKFKPGDRMIEEVDREIADTGAALEKAKLLHSTDTTTDVNPIRQSLDGEEYRLRQMEAGLVSRIRDLDRLLGQQQTQIGHLERSSIKLDDLDRDIKESEATLAAYREKTIAAKVSEDLDSEKISNVVVASWPRVPALPLASPLNYFTALAFAIFFSLTAGLLWESRTSAYTERTRSRLDWACRSWPRSEWVTADVDWCGRRAGRGPSAVWALATMWVALRQVAVFWRRGIV